MRSSALHLRIHWIMPTHGDITADCVAKAFGVPINTDPRALVLGMFWGISAGGRWRITPHRVSWPDPRLWIGRAGDRESLSALKL